MSRCASLKNKRNGERKAIGRPGEASSLALNRAERNDPEGRRNPEGERRHEDRTGLPDQPEGNGLRAMN